MTSDTGIPLTPHQVARLKWQAQIQCAVFSVVALMAGAMGLGGLVSFVPAALRSETMPWFMILGVVLALALCLMAGFVFAWLAVANIAFASRINEVMSQWYEGPPVKETSLFRQSANIGAGGSMLTSPQVAGAFLRHDGKRYGVEIDLFRRIPNEGTFRFYYVRRPGFPGVLTPYLIIDFAPVAPASASDAACRCMTPPFNYADYTEVAIGTDDTGGRFGEVSLLTCKSCGHDWLKYHVEYEAFSKSGRWFRGPVSPEVARSVRPETALALLGSMEWYFAGGSYFDSTGFKTSGVPAASP